MLQPGGDGSQLDRRWGPSSVSHSSWARAQKGSRQAGGETRTLARARKLRLVAAALGLDGL